jgi:transcriptional regulator with XRE-family HTH domain
MDRPELADFLRIRRQALQPEDVGLFRGPRRRTSGLRREEVAELCGMSVDYYARLERGNGPQPSEQMAAALARGLRLSLAERDHLFLLAGHNAPQRILRSDHVSPGLMRVLDRLDDTPAQIMGGLGETLVQTRLARALPGDQTQFTGLARSAVYRWFTDPASRLASTTGTASTKTTAPPGEPPGRPKRHAAPCSAAGHSRRRDDSQPPPCCRH